jgi:hypothetical protein
MKVALARMTAARTAMTRIRTVIVSGVVMVVQSEAQVSKKGVTVTCVG